MIARTPPKARAGIALALAALFLLYRWLVPRLTAGWQLLGNEAVLFLFLAACAWAGSGVYSARKEKPLRLVFHALLLGALITALLLSWSDWKAVPSGSPQAGPAGLVDSCFLLLLFAAALALAFSALRLLFLLKLPRGRGVYFEAMGTCFALTFLAASALPPAVPFMTSLSVCLVAVNSFRVKWIAFLVKRQKKLLIVLAGLSLAVFLADTLLLFGAPADSLLASALSPGVFRLGVVVLLYGACYSGVILFATLFHLPTADAYDRKAEEFASLVDLSESITGMVEFNELAEKVTRATASICQGDSAWLLVRENDDFSVPAANGLGMREARELGMLLLGELDPGSRAVKVLQDRKLKIRIQNDVLTYSFRSLLIAPLRVEKRTIGYLFVAIRKDALFEDEDVHTIEAFANSAAIALENARLLAIRVEKQRLLKELEVARLVQKRLLPRDLPRVAFADISVYFSPAYEVGGDYYDFFLLDDRRLGFVIADVSGKGLAAAFVMAELKGIFESLAGVVTAPGQLLAKANDVLRKSLEKNRFVSASYGLIDPRSMVLRVARAGHMPFFLNSGGRIETLVPPGLVLGAADEPLFSEKLKETAVPLHAGDAIVFITDGISEAKNLFGSEFGYERLKSVIQSVGDASAEGLAKFIMAEVKAFVNQPVQYDDITLLVVKIR
jgi:sigma-B regulation protein RsbU (phosphoserine phosphatase)